LFVLPFTALLPGYAKDIFNGTAATLGYIEGAVAAGALCGACYLALQKPGSDLYRTLSLNILICGAGLMLLPGVSCFPVAVVLIAVSGFGMLSVTTIINTHIQSMVSPAMRGRVAAFYAMCFFGLVPAGTVAAAAVSGWLGLQRTVLIQGMAGVIIGLWQMGSQRKEEGKNAEQFGV